MNFIRKQPLFTFKKRKSPLRNNKISSHSDVSAFKKDFISQEDSETEFVNPGGGIEISVVKETFVTHVADETGETHSGRVGYAESGSDTHLNPQEKKDVKDEIKTFRDRGYLFNHMGARYPCDKCGRSSYTISYCEHCLRDSLTENFKNWTSGNSIIDAAIKTSQIILPLPEHIIEWIPYDDLCDIQHMVKGGCSSVSSAVWKKGYIISFDKEKQECVRFGPEDVALKRLDDSKSPDSKFLCDLRTYLLCQSSGLDVLRCRGVSRDPDTGDLILVMPQMKEDLRHFLQNSKKITWSDVYQLFWRISSNLASIHSKKLVHKHLHPGNVLRYWRNSWYIADLGLCGPPNRSLTSVYGHLPYIAPEVLVGEGYTRATDIYSVGILMFEVATRAPPFDGRQHDCVLQFDILDGCRPKTSRALPPAYKALMKRCWDAKPENRPTAVELSNFFFDQCRLSSSDPSFGSALVEMNAVKEESRDSPSQASVYPIMRFEEEEIDPEITECIREMVSNEVVYV